MNKKDLLKLSMLNLRRHRGRTFLTVLGVMIGCCSVIIMISIGIGMKKSQERLLAQMGDLTVIQVYKGNAGKRGKKLNKRTIQAFQHLDGVETATPKLTVRESEVKLYAGADRRYAGTGVEMVGMDVKAAQAMGYQLREGSWEMAGENRMWLGEMTEFMFGDSKRPPGKNMVDLFSLFTEEKEKPKPFFDGMKTPFYLEIDSKKEGEKKQLFRLTPSGRLKEDYAKGEETSVGILFDLEDLEQILGELKKNSGERRRGKEEYENALVKVRSMGDVAAVEKEIQKMGFRTSSMESIRKPMEQEARQKQMMLGGLGAVSLFVAALGITNTMIMSISERTREIGVMKSLGCFLSDIRKMFLLEAGGIGLLGGVSGVLVSILISRIMNLAAGMGEEGGTFPDPGMGIPSGPISVIPWWLCVLGILFSVLAGIASGYYPAGKAVKIPALEAIKHE
ncbi:MAG TPA: ABC transporter permease [Candidatus Enterocloster faecavium]|uniref:ABC transporter permease n=1 Tax=Candidatus Enterocloster faecavium TaxID=2838560 RepID=A0A9D2L7I8_9FIRM|nr:ABC transporter permease [Candidatus Enterocloster faecavium]